MELPLVLMCTCTSDCMRLFVDGLLWQGEGPVCLIVDTLLGLLDKEVVDNSKTCAEYFLFFKNYVRFVSSISFFSVRYCGRDSVIVVCSC